MILNAVPFPRKVPPHETEYHCHVATVPNVPPVSVNVIAVAEQTVRDGFPVTDETAVDNELTVRVIVKHPVVLQVPSALTK